MSKFEVIESRHYVSDSGKAASIYGAAPWFTESQRISEGWKTVSRGWTVRNPFTGEVGACRKPWPTKEEAQAFADKVAPCRTRIGD